MKNNKILPVVLIGVIVLGLGTYFFYSKNKNVSPVNEPVIPVSTSVIYNNTEYGFTFSLPDSWKGYTIVKNIWTGNSLKDGTPTETGPKLLIRNPQWTEAVHYEDIPIVVFTIAQWNSYVAENFSVFAAPFPASELGRNNMYVFALPPRWDFDYSKGYEEAQNIVKSKSLKPYSVSASRNSTLPLFTWRYVKASSLNLDGQPKTNVYLDVTYPSGKTQSKLIATTDGGCNDLSDANEDRVENSAVAQCYYAGLGYRFKVTKGTQSYLVMKKSFEEASPNQTPPVDTYKAVSTFPLSNQ